VDGSPEGEGRVDYSSDSPGENASFCDTYEDDDNDDMSYEHDESFDVEENSEIY
jgi:hypothetical protein